MQLNILLTLLKEVHDKTALMKLLLNYNNDLQVYHFVEKMLKFVDEDNSTELKKHLESVIPMRPDSDPASCVLSVKSSCEHLMIYAALQGKHTIVDVLGQAKLQPQVSIYQTISEEYIQKARELLEQFPQNQ